MSSGKKKRILLYPQPIILLALKKSESAEEDPDVEELFRDRSAKPYDMLSLPGHTGYTVLFIPMLPDRGNASC
jgi:hypothetical protein